MNAVRYPAATGKPVAVDISKALASQLAYYAGPYGPGVIGPVGWHCFWVSSGPGSAYLITVTPTTVELTPDLELSPQGASAPVIFLETSADDTGSGADVVNTIAERFFPSYYDGENPWYVERIPVYPHDHYVPFVTKLPPLEGFVDFIEFTTPAGRDGFGTWENELTKSGLPIDGLVYYSKGSYAAGIGILRVRLPGSMAKLKAVILDNFPSMLVNFWNQVDQQQGGK